MVSTAFLMSAACLFLVQDVLAVEVRVTPAYQVVAPGDPLTVVCEVSEPIEYCSFTIPPEMRFVLSPKKFNFSNTFFYPKNASMDRGQCAFYTPSVTEKMNGNISCKLSLTNGNQELEATMSLVIARTPSSPMMSVSRSASNTMYYKEGETFTANCTVKNGRPAANISFYMGDEKINSGLSAPDIQAGDSKSLETVSRTLTRTAVATDNGKELKCVAEHPLIGNRNVTTRLITVEYAPKSLEPLEYFGLKEGQPGIINVSVMANPRPEFVWTIDGQDIKEGEGDPSGKYHVDQVSSVTDKETGSWKTTLIIDNLSKDDEHITYILTANNKYGQEKYTIRISTSLEPKAVDIGAGMIALIVIIVCAILLLMSIIIVARAKGRLCFAGKSEVQPTGGESSDTESADHHKNTKPKLLFTSVFKKKSDKVSADAPVNQSKDVTVNDEKVDKNEEEDEVRLKPKTDEEGVVYAELDLQNSAPSRGLLIRPENDKTEYAEIIHTKDNK